VIRSIFGDQEVQDLGHTRTKIFRPGGGIILDTLWSSRFSIVVSELRTATQND